MENQEVVACIERYFRAGDRGSPEDLRASFHPSAMMYRVGPAGELVGLDQPGFQARVEAAGPCPARERHIGWVWVHGDAAGASLRSEFDGYAYLDFVSLLRIEGRWQIVGKIFHRATRP